MKKFLLIVFSILLVLISAVVIALSIANEPLPEGEEGQKVEELTDKMLNALNYEAYQQLDVIKWSFPRGHHFVWNKAQDSVEVKWSDYRVIFKTKTLDGFAYQNEEELAGADKQKALDKAWALFANDSFWLVAPFKVRDPGTSRKYVVTERGPGILVTYSSGGVTPGDSYLWILGEDYKPLAWKLWTQILPLQGIEFSWHGWKQHQGVWLAPLHRGSGPVSVDLKNVEVN